MRRKSATITLTDSGDLLLDTPYHPGFVQEIKSIPSTARKYDYENKTWTVDYKYADQVRWIIAKYFGQEIDVPAQNKSTPTIQRFEVIIRYLGACKDRGDGSRTAYGAQSEGSWDVIFSESVLREWFGIADDPKNQPTLFGVLGISKSSSVEEIKKAFRRMALQWHPDVCKEPDASEVFIKIKRAYDVLSDPITRAKYEAGLVLERTIATTEYTSPDVYRAPLRCGKLLVEGYLSLGRIVVNKILSWDDVTDQNGRILVSSWPYGANMWIEHWV